MRQCFYPDELWGEISKNYKYIPRKLRDDEKLKLDKRYWIPDYGLVRVKEIINIGTEYYIISYSNGSMFGVISYPVDNCYELLKNFNSIEKDDILEKNKPIYGAEIKYWFAINNKDTSSSILDNLHSLKDSTKYLIRANKKSYDFIKK